MMAVEAPPDATRRHQRHPARTASNLVGAAALRCTARPGALLFPPAHEEVSAPAPTPAMAALEGGRPGERPPRPRTRVGGARPCAHCKGGSAFNLPKKGAPLTRQRRRYPLFFEGRTYIRPCCMHSRPASGARSYRGHRRAARLTDVRHQTFSEPAEPAAAPEGPLAEAQPPAAGPSPARPRGQQTPRPARLPRLTNPGGGCNGLKASSSIHEAIQRRPAPPRPSRVPAERREGLKVKQSGEALGFGLFFERPMG